jgi:cephalosporin hydroxylase
MESLETLTVASMVDRAFAEGMVQVREEITGFVSFLRPRRLRHAIEIGSEAGGTFYLWCQLVSGMKISVDLPTGPFGSGKFAEQSALLDRMGRMLSWAPNVRIVTGDSHADTTKQHVVELLEGQTVDLLFIDGDHSYEGVKRDFEMYREFVGPGGLIAFHDVNDTPWHRRRGCHVGRFWQELEGSKLEFNQFSHWAGIGVLEA